MKAILLFLLTSLGAFAALNLQGPMDIVDDWCMDTYCGGDFNYYAPTLSYDSQTDLFRISFTAEDWNKGEILLEELQQIETQGIKLPLIAAHPADWHTGIVGNKQQIVIETIAMEPSYWQEYDLQPVAHFSCYFGLAEENKTQAYLDENLYDITLDCVDGFTQLLYN